MNDSTISKMQLHYWEAKQTFLKKTKCKEDDFLVASDAELDAKLELLKSIDETNQNLLNLFELYQDRVCALAQEECILGRFLRECSKHDTTKAGNLMSGSGKTFLFAGHQFIMLRNVLIRSFRDVQTFQYRAVADTFDTVEQMEKSRTAYRAALLWMKDISKQLDPEAYIQMDKFKKIQNHVREKKKVFEKLKIDTIQKIDLLSASRCNLFSNILLSYQNTLKSVWTKTTKTMNIFVDTFKSHLNYEFTMLKELNVDTSADKAIQNFEEKLKEILVQQNTNEMDMLIFFDADYTDEKDENQKKSEMPRHKNNQENKTFRKNDSNFKLKMSQKTNNNNNNTHDNLKSSNKSLFDFEIIDEKEKNNLSNHFNQLNSYLPSSLIDFEQINMEDTNSFIDKLISESQSYSSNANEKQSEKTLTKSPTNLDTWLNLFGDIDPLSNPEEFDKRFSSDKTSTDRNC